MSASAGTTRVIQAVVLAWFAMLGFDFLLHAGLLARFYVEPGPFLLPPIEAFRRIPLGYASFLLHAVLLVWLMNRLRVGGAKSGLRFGLQLGILVWGAAALGMLSITSASPTLLLGWFLGQSVELGIAGAVAGAALAAARLRGVVFAVVGLILLSVTITVILQASGLAPALRV